MESFFLKSPSLTSEQELREIELIEAKKQVEIVENQMRNVRDEFDESIGVCIAQSLRDINGLFDKLGQSGYFLQLYLRYQLRA
jgi:hypothetical protein